MGLPDPSPTTALNTQNGGRVDKAVAMLGAVVMATSAPPSVILSSPHLFHKLCRLIKLCLEDTGHHREVQLKALQSTNSLLSNKALRVSSLRELGSHVFATLKLYVVVGPVDGGGEGRESELDLPALESVDDPELLVIQETVKAVETIAGFVDEEKRGCIFSSPSC